MSKKILAEIEMLDNQIKLQKERLKVLEGERRLRIGQLDFKWVVETDTILFAGEKVACMEFIRDNLKYFTFQYNDDDTINFWTKWNVEPYEEVYSGVIRQITELDDEWQETELSLQNE